MNGFLPVTKKDMLERGWEQADFVYVCGDAYVDHPSFGAAIITRVLENAGFKVTFLAQPDWRSDKDFTRFGRPRLGFLVSSGNIDSMVAHYTVAKKRRSADAYSPGGKVGLRPDRAVIVYCNKIREIYGDIPIIIGGGNLDSMVAHYSVAKIRRAQDEYTPGGAAGKRPDRSATVYTQLAKQAYPDLPVILGGLEASLRRFAHYDYWDDKVRRSILFDSQADLLAFGMGERSMVEIATRLDGGEDISQLHDIRGTCYSVDVRETPYVGVECPSFENVCNSKKEYAVSCRIQQDEQDFFRGKVIKQRHGNRMLVQNQPAMPISQDELDEVYALPYMRTYHPCYEKDGGVPGIEEVRFSIAHNRGCFGACNFCSIAFHQGRYITTRSKESIVNEAKLLTTLPDFKGYIHDIGGPTANFRRPSCEGQESRGLCKGKKCLAGRVAKHRTSTGTYVQNYFAVFRQIYPLGHTL